MNKIATCLGLAIGDALGQPFEFCTPDQIKKSGWNGDLIYGDIWKLKAGQYTDDTLMALCIADALVADGKFVAQTVADNYIKWVESGNLRGIGNTCERSIYNMKKGFPLDQCGKKNIGRAKPSFKRVGDVGKPDLATDFCGNGTVMRAAPIGLFFRNDLKALEAAAIQDATMTHDHPDARDASYVLCFIIAKLSQGEDLTYAVSQIVDLNQEYPHVLESIICGLECHNKEMSLDEVGTIMGTTGCAHSTLGTALYCAASSNSFQEALVKAVMMGGDTDTRAAITGAILGTVAGVEGIPAEWVKQVENTERLQELDRLLSEEA